MIGRRETVARKCYVCGQAANRVVATEVSEVRFDRPVVPEGVYRLARCSRCSTLYLDSDVDEAYLARMYESETTDWVFRSRGGAPQAELASGRLPSFVAHWNAIRGLRRPSRGDRLLDIGCQTGEFASLAQKDGVVPHGVELSPDYADSARNRWGEGSVHVGPLATAPFEAGSFHYVTAFETLEHMLDPISELRRIRRLIAERGVLAVSVPSSNYFHLKYWALRRSPIAPFVSMFMKSRGRDWGAQVLPHTHIYNFSDRSVRMMLELAGFRVAMTEPSGWVGRHGGLLDRVSAEFDSASGLHLRVAPSIFAIATLG